MGHRPMPMTPLPPRTESLSYPAEWLLDIFNGNPKAPRRYSPPLYAPHIVTGNEKALWWAPWAVGVWAIMVIAGVLYLCGVRP